MLSAQYLASQTSCLAVQRKPQGPGKQEKVTSVPVSLQTSSLPYETSNSNSQKCLPQTYKKDSVPKSQIDFNIDAKPIEGKNKFVKNSYAYSLKRSNKFSKNDNSSSPSRVKQGCAGISISNKNSSPSSITEIKQKENTLKNSITDEDLLSLEFDEDPFEEAFIEESLLKAAESGLPSPDFGKPFKPPSFVGSRKSDVSIRNRDENKIIKSKFPFSVTCNTRNNVGVSNPKIKTNVYNKVPDRNCPTTQRRVDPFSKLSKKYS